MGFAKIRFFFCVLCYMFILSCNFFFAEFRTMDVVLSIVMRMCLKVVFFFFFLFKILKYFILIILKIVVYFLYISIIRQLI